MMLQMRMMYIGEKTSKRTVCSGLPHLPILLIQHYLITLEC